MVTAIVLANVERDAVNDVAQALVELDGVAEVYSVAGEWDLAIIIRVLENDQLADLVTEQLRRMKSITKTTTLIGFRAYSNYDLERMFSVGFEEDA
ncbi:MAG: Lrp/AsnC ligand binding domain-containing protein [Candidatus Hydrogenedentes bacterium]|nr:Lrp/AsnC ligand binding domain-containing protein [Candidatus Hydrogenedentota bacterium]